MGLPRCVLLKASGALLFTSASGGFQAGNEIAVPITDVVGVSSRRPIQKSLPGVGIQVNSTNERIGAANLNPSMSFGTGQTRKAEAQGNMFSYHKDFWPLDSMDWFTLVFSSIGLVLAAGGGIGGGGILVPLYMIFLKFRPKHAIALSNFTILGGSIANTIMNLRKTDDAGASLIDWDIIVMMEPSTIAGAVLGSFLSKYLPDFVLAVCLASVVAMLSYRTLDKGVMMFQRESEDEHHRLEGNHTDTEVSEECRSDDELGESRQLIGRDEVALIDRATPWSKIAMLTACFAGCIMLTVLKGSGHGSVIGVECGSAGFWAVSIASVPWVFLFGAYFRRRLIRESSCKEQVAGGCKGEAGDVRWDAVTTVKYPLICSIAGVLAGLFGVGGGIVKGPLMLEMGVNPMVASATAATMILFTTSAACVSFQVFGLLEAHYGAACFLLGLVCTAIGQGAVNAWMKAAKRQSPPVLAIGLVMALSTLLVGLEAFERFTTAEDWFVLFMPSDICSLTE